MAAARKPQVRVGADKVKVRAGADSLRVHADALMLRIRAAADKVAVLVAIVTSEIGSDPRNGPRSDQRFGSPMCT